jgi:hypothetical protein
MPLARDEGEEAIDDQFLLASLVADKHAGAIEFHRAAYLRNE